MREILFRAKRIDNGEWVEGYYGIKGKGTDIENHYIMVPTFQSGIGNYDYMFYFTDVHIDPETICQYIGLKDKNGNRIWENDIVLLREEIQDYEWKATVKFGNPNCEYNWGWQLVPIGECDMNKDILLWIDMEIASCEVVGNIFDNPELLKGDQSCTDL